MKYKVWLHYPLDYNVKSFLYANDINVVDGDIGDMSIVIESELSSEQILHDCSVDVQLIEPIKD